MQQRAPNHGSSHASAARLAAARSGAPRIEWPGGKRFAFTVFDDPDGYTEDSRRYVYPFLSKLGFRTTMAVWPLGPLREINCIGETLESPDYLAAAKAFQADGFEMGYHLAAPHDCTREEAIRALDVFAEHFGHDPHTMANHFNADALHHGINRLTGPWRRGLYSAMTGFRNGRRFQGAMEGSPHYWADVARRRIRYCRNLVYTDVNTLAAAPLTPYRDPARDAVPLWFSSAEGAECEAFCRTISEANQDQLEAEGGCCIMYTHFGKGFADRANGELHPRFKALMERLAAKDGWFATTAEILDHIRAQRGEVEIDPAERARMEWRWLAQKAFRGTS